MESNLEPNTVQKKRRNPLKILLWIIVILLALGGLFFCGVIAYTYMQRNEGYTTDAYESEPNGLASESDYSYWKNATFTIPEYDNIPENFQRGIVKIFMDNGYYDTDENANYFFSKISDRAKKVYAFGNFTGGSAQEMAFLLEKQDFESSALFIISENGDLLYWKELSYELPTITSFKKRAKIFLDTLELEPAPNDGIISQYKDSKYVFIYNQDSKTFDKYYQYTDEDIKNANEESDYEEDYDEEYEEIQQQASDSVN